MPHKRREPDPKIAWTSCSSVRPPINRSAPADVYPMDLFEANARGNEIREPLIAPIFTGVSSSILMYDFAFRGKPAMASDKGQNMHKLARSLLIVVLLGVAGFGWSPALSAGAATVNVAASADAYVAADVPDANFGSGTTLQADASPVNVIYLKFDVTNFTTPPDKVTLQVFTRSTGTTPVRLAVEPSSWTESGSTYSFALTTGSTAVRLFDSREAANAPHLEVTASAPSSDPVIVGAGDVACSPTEASYNSGAGTATACHMGATAQLIQSLNPASVLMLGDGQYNSGSLSDYKTSYGGSWGAFKSLTDPTVGNHEYGTTGAGGYFTYFGKLATPRQP